MKKRITRMSVREIRLKRPEAERMLASAGEIVVTHETKPVARILRYQSRRYGKRARLVF